MDLAETTSSAPAESAPEPTAATPEAEASEHSEQTQTRQRLTPFERRERMIQRLRQGNAGKHSEDASRAAAPPLRRSDAANRSAVAGSTDEAPDSSPPGESGASEVTDDAPPAADKPAQPTPDRELELKLSRVSRELRDARAEAVESREAAKAYNALSDKLKLAKGDAYAAVQLLPELLGMDFGELADFVVANEGRFEERKRWADLPPELREELELAKKARVEREQREKSEAEERQQTETLTKYKESATRFLESNKEDYPLAHAIGWAPEQIARSAIQRNTRDARPLLDELEKNLRSELSGALGKPEVIRALIQGDKELGEKFRQALSVPGKPDKSPAAASLRSGPSAYAEGPRSLNNGVTASDTADELDPRAARRQRIMGAVKAYYGR